jgi:hypothetical protein
VVGETVVAGIMMKGDGVEDAAQKVIDIDIQYQ